MGIREKLLDFKKRLSDRKMYSIVIAIIAAVTIWGVAQYKHSMSLRQELDNQYNRAFFDMVGYVNSVEALLAKSRIVSTVERSASTMQEAWRQANLAQTNLGQLPISQLTLANTSKFLTQVGDLAYSLNNQNMGGRPLDQKQDETLKSMHKYAVALRESLADLQAQLSSGRLKWGDLANKGTPLFQKASQDLQVQSLENIDKTFTDYPSLIYDGPFSDHISMIKPKALTGDKGNLITIEEAKKKCEDFFGADKIQSIENTGRNDSEPIMTYSYKVVLKGAPKDHWANIDITQKGGLPYGMIYGRPVAEKKLGIDQAKDFASKFLERLGFTSMVDTYYLAEDNTATINYAYSQQNVVVYPDLIKVKVALDNGEIVGFESKSYIFAHTQRDIPAPGVTMAQARAKINPRLKILGSGMAIIPTDYKTELLTYEFKGSLDSQDFLVYINAETGREENILIIVNTPNGTLTY